MDKKKFKEKLLPVLSRVLLCAVALAVWLCIVYYKYTSAAQIHLEVTGLDLEFWQWAILPDFGMVTT